MYYCTAVTRYCYTIPEICIASTHKNRTGNFMDYCTAVHTRPPGADCCTAQTWVPVSERSARHWHSNLLLPQSTARPWKLLLSYFRLLSIRPCLTRNPSRAVRTAFPCPSQARRGRKQPAASPPAAPLLLPLLKYRQPWHPKRP